MMVLVLKVWLVGVVIMTILVAIVAARNWKERR